MAIGVAVDILGCTGSVEERASTLNRIILVALELKDSVGDLFAFTALMKALDLPQVRLMNDALNCKLGGTSLGSAVWGDGECGKEVKKFVQAGCNGRQVRTGGRVVATSERNVFLFFLLSRRSWEFL